MQFSHHKEIIHSSSQYINQTDPVAFRQFRVGEVVIICEEKNVAIAMSSIIATGNCCPYCKRDINIPLYPPPPPLPQGLGLWETLVFSFLIGGGGSLLLSFTLLKENIIYYLTQILWIGIVLLVVYKITKQPWGVALAVALANLIPLFFNINRISLGYIAFFVATVLLSWIISVNIKTVL